MTCMHHLGYLSSLGNASSGIRTDNTALMAASSMLNDTAYSAMVDRDPSPKRELSSDPTHYNRLPGYCK